jgi:hypothetical protein
MDSKSYALQLEKKLIEQFKQTFYDKLGYEPMVLTKVQIDTDEYLPILSLDNLQAMFEPFLPMKYDRKLTLQSKHRYRELVELRNIYCYMARVMGYSLIMIGQSLGNRDHTTVIHNVCCFKNLMETNEPFRQKYLAILTYIKQQYESSVVAKPDQVQCEPEPALLP